MTAENITSEHDGLTTIRNVRVEILDDHAIVQGQKIRGGDGYKDARVDSLRIRYVWDELDGWVMRAPITTRIQDRLKSGDGWGVPRSGPTFYPSPAWSPPEWLREIIKGQRPKVRVTYESREG